MIWLYSALLEIKKGVNKNMNILIVDDSTFVRSVLSQYVISYGFRIIGEAKDGKDAVQKYQMLKPDIVTMDITMPEMDGIEAVKGIMQIDPAAKIIICSALGHEAKVLKAIKAGAKSFLVKPVTAERLIEELVKVSESY
jgi:two-component system chemotaxis response regulator CheY